MTTPLVTWTAAQLPQIEALPDTPDVLGYGLERASARGLWLELGVANGASLGRIAREGWVSAPDKRPRVVGFDSFEGLPEEWRWNASQFVPKGAFKPDAIPVVPGAELVVGLFQATIAPWLETLAPDDVVTFVHVDCDLYSAAKDALTLLAPRLADGAIIVFDELIGYHGFDAHEWRALYEITDVEQLFGFRWLARKAGGQQVALTVRREEKLATPVPPSETTTPQAITEDVRGKGSSPPQE